MKHQLLNYLVLSTILLFLGCNKESISPVNTTSFNIHRQVVAFSEEASSLDDYTSTVVKAKMIKKLSRWTQNNDNPFFLSRVIEFDLTLANGEILNVEFTLRNSESNEDLLLLDENNTLSETSHSTKYWQYKDKSMEVDNFYNESMQFRVKINNNTFLGFSPDTDHFSIKKVLIKNLNGEDRIYAEIQFQGITYGYSYWSYDIQNGTFSGIID